jgi:hypothetical protein
MELAKELFDQIVAALAQKGAREPGEPERHHEQRSSSRIAISADVMLTPHGVMGAKQRQAKLRSLSRTGAAVIDHLTRQAGDKLVLYLPKPDGQSVPIVCMVMNTRISGEGFRVGMKFLSRAEQTGPAMIRSAQGLINRPVNPGQLHILDAIAWNGPARATVVGDAGDGAARPEQREQRVEINVQAMMSPYEDGRSGAIEFVTVKDISADGGVCILRAEAMKRDEQFLLQIPRPQGKPLTLICTVVGCRRLDDDNFRIGARYETRLSMHDTGGGGWFKRLRRWFGRAA